MTVELKPEIEALIQKRLQSGAFAMVEGVIERTLEFLLAPHPEGESGFRSVLRCPNSDLAWSQERHLGVEERELSKDRMEKSSPKLRPLTVLDRPPKPL